MSLQQILATRDRASFSHRVNFDKILYTNLQLMDDWCNKHCSGAWRRHSVYALYFQFQDERDATMFTLTWGTAEGNVLK